MADMRDPSDAFPITATVVRYIKLGPGGAWAERAIAEGKLVLDFREVPHEVAASGDEAALLDACLRFRGGHERNAKTDAGEISAFYQASSSDLWITFHAGRLWWAFCERGVHPSAPEDGLGARYRRVIYGWRSTDADGAPLHLASLDGRITQLAAYRRTICAVKAADRVLRAINAEPHPDGVAAASARDTLLASVSNLIQQLSPQDFEVLIDLIIARLGWRRVGALGGPQKTVDIELEQPLTGERAFVQVKSRSSQAELDSYVAEFERRDEDRMIYAWHSGPELTCENSAVLLMGPDTNANSVLKAGLLDWLMQKAR
ncbi:MAG: hypothetical protein ABL308_05800 [Oceanicaulis sp.]